MLAEYLMNKSRDVPASSGTTETPRATPSTPGKRKGDEPEAWFIEHIMALGAARNAAATPGLFSNPRWEMLTELVIRTAMGKVTKVSDLMALGTTAPTTGLRHLQRLEAAGFIARVPDPNDARRVLIELREDGRRIVNGYFTALCAAIRAADD
jgi:DNA-binding MarR family transcriptional regulator